MNKFSTIRLAGMGVVAASAISLAPLASAEVEVAASAGVANMYLWRGFDLGQGSAQVSGDLTVSAGGAYTGVWLSSGDANSTEYDVYLGYRGEVDQFYYDLSVWSYVYPSGSSVFTGDADKLGDFSEVILTLGYSSFYFSYYDNVASGGFANGYEYYVFGGGMGDFSALLGIHDPEEEKGQAWDDDMIHLDFSYAYNENLSFTASQNINSDDEADYNNNLLLVVSYSLDIK